jgi:hypothetical protein
MSKSDANSNVVGKDAENSGKPSYKAQLVTRASTKNKKKKNNRFQRTSGKLF